MTIDNFFVGLRPKAPMPRACLRSRPIEKVHPLDLKAGDRVIFGKWSGTEVKIEGEELMIMKESDVMGIIDGGAAAGNKR